MASASPLSAARLEPLARLGVVLRHAMTVGVKQVEVDHGVRVALVGGLLEPLARLGVVPRHALTVGVKRAENASSTATASPVARTGNDASAT